MGALQRAAALSQHGLRLIGAANIARAQRDLRAFLDTAIGCQDIVVAVAFVDFGAFQDRQSLLVLDDHRTGIKHALAIRAHAMEDQWPGAMPGMDQPSLAIIVPEGAGVFQHRLVDHLHRRAPRTFRLAGSRHEDALVRRRPIDIEQSGMMADRWGPDPASIAGAADRLGNGIGQAVGAGHVIFGREWQARQDMAKDRPVDQVAGMEDRDARREMEARGYHIIILPDADDIRVGIIRIENGVAVHRSGGSRPRLSAKAANQKRSA